MSRTYRIFFLLLLGVSASISCKKLNEDYPPTPWSTFFEKTGEHPARPVSSILFNDENDVWLGSQRKEGLLYYNGKKWESFTASNTGIEFDSVTAIVRDGHGRYWVGWKSGLAYYDHKQWFKVTQFDGIIVTSLTVEGVSNLWVGMTGNTETGGLAHFSNQQWIFISPNSSQMSSRKVLDVLYQPFTGLWVCTADQGLYNLKNNLWNNYSIANNAITCNDFRKVTNDTEGRIWASNAKSQLICIDKGHLNVLETGVGIPITSLVVNHNGSLWCGTSGAGLLLLKDNRWASYTKVNSRLPSDSVLCMVVRDQNALIFSLTNSKVLTIQ